MFTEFDYEHMYGRIAQENLQREGVEQLILHLWESVAEGDAVRYFHVLHAIVSSYVPAYEHQLKQGKMKQDDLIKAYCPPFIRDSIAEAQDYFCEMDWGLLPDTREHKDGK